jgi:negative regulator of sigma E activity
MQISAYVDGELPDSEADLLVRRMSQDKELRREAAEFLELGRALRGEASVPGIERLRERVAAALDDKALEDAVVSTEAPRERSLWPLARVAVAASVALVALLALQFTQDIGQGDVAESTVAEVEADPGYTVPQQIDEQLRQYYLSHGDSSSELGANGMNTRLVTLRISEEALDEEDEPEDDAAADEEDAEAATPQP